MHLVLIDFDSPASSMRTRTTEIRDGFRSFYRDETAGLDCLIHSSRPRNVFWALVRPLLYSIHPTRVRIGEANVSRLYSV